MRSNQNGFISCQIGSPPPSFRMTHTPPSHIHPRPISVTRKLFALIRPLASKKFKVRKASNDRNIRNSLIHRQEGLCPGLITVRKDSFRLCGSIYLTDCDHIIERRHYGADKPYNLQMLCHTCHVIKTNVNRVSQRLL